MKKLPALLVVLLTHASGIAVGWTLHAALYPDRTISGTSSHGGGVTMNAVAYEDGTTDLLLRDVDSGWATSLEAPAVWMPDTRDNSPLPPHPVPPRIVARGDVWQRAVYTYDVSVGDWCQDRVVFVKRPEKEVRHFSVPFCIDRTLDARDFTVFLAFSKDRREMTVGSYEDGRVIDAQAVPDGYEVLGFATSWETDRAVALFADARCRFGDPECLPLRMLRWDFRAKAVTDIPVPAAWNQASDLSLAYDHDKNEFALTGSGMKPIVIDGAF